jgi:hypothetical protein
MALVDGYRLRPAAPPCPGCGETYSAIDTTGELGHYKYVCWCGARCELRATGDELVALGVPRETVAALERGDLR